MTRSPIYSLLAVLLALAAGPASAADWGHLKLQLVYDGTPPAPSKINVNKDPQFCNKFNLVDNMSQVRASAGHKSVQHSNLVSLC